MAFSNRTVIDWRNFGLAVVSGIGIYLYNKYKKRQAVADIKWKSTYDVLFFEEGYFEEPKHSFGTTCFSLNSSVKTFHKLCEYINSAHTTLDICILLFTSESILKAIIELVRQRQIQVRVLIDSNSLGDKMCKKKLLSLEQYGGKMKVAVNTHLHHKFVIVDGKLLLTGSANWTEEAMFQNNENILVTSEPSVVEQFVTEYERLWNLYAEMNFQK